MVILDYQKHHHHDIIHACVEALRRGKIVAYPTDTSYGLACDIGNDQALTKLYRIKERSRGKPIHIIIPSIAYAKKIAVWDAYASKLAKRFWPGPLSLVLRIKKKVLRNRGLRRLSAGGGFIGLRYPKNKIALDLSRLLKRPITTTSANPSAHSSGGFDSYSVDDIVAQFKNKKYKPDIIINVGRLRKRKPSTLVKISEDGIKVLRVGPITEKQIKQILK